MLEVENSIYQSMCNKMAEFKTLARSSPAKANPKLTALKVSLAQVEAEIDDLLATLKGANSKLLSYANKMIEELDARKQSLCKQIADLTAQTISPKKMERISGYLDKWESISFEDKRLVAGELICKIRAKKGNIHIEWKF